MRTFTDLNLRPPIRNPEKTREIIRKSAELGYDSIGLALPEWAEQKEIQEIREICGQEGVDLITRIDLTPRRPRELLIDLRRLRRSFEVIAVRCFSREVARQAAKDRRVDLISFPSIDPRRRFFDSAEAELASGALASLELDMSLLLHLGGLQRVRLISSLRRESSIARKFDVPIVLSSGADDVYFLRGPEGYAVLAYLFGLDYETARMAVSENPEAIVERNRKKLSPNYVAPGVYIVRRGEDCLDV